MNRSLSKTISYIVFALIGVGLLIFVFKDVDLAAMWNDITHANYWYVAVALILAMGGYVFRAARWSLLIESTCDRTPRFGNVFWAEMFGYFANMALPRIGEITRCGALTKTEKLPFDKLIGTVIVERMFDVLMMLILAVVTFFIKIDFFGAFILDKIITPTFSRFSEFNLLWIITVSVISIVIFCVFVYYLRKGNRLSEKILSFIKGVIDGFSSVRKLKKRGLFIVYTFLLWLCYWLMTWAVCFAIPQTANMTIIDGLFLLIVGSIGMSIPVQGGIGAYHYIVALALTIYGFDFNTVGLLYATISHESQLIVEIILGLASVYFVFRKKQSDESIGNNIA